MTIYDMVQYTSATSGTGTLTLTSVVAGYQSWANAGIANNTIVSYGIADTGPIFEVGSGTYITNSSGTFLLRTTVRYSSNATSPQGPINCTGSNTVVYSTMLDYDYNTFSPANSINIGTTTINSSGYYSGNSTANTFGNATIDIFANSTSQTVITPVSFSTGNSTANSFGNSIIEILANSTAQTVITPVSFSTGNSTANSFGNSIMDIVANSTAQTVITPIGIFATGNSTINAVYTSTGSLVANSTAQTSINPTSISIGPTTTSVGYSIANSTTNATANMSGYFYGGQGPASVIGGTLNKFRNPHFNIAQRGKTGTTATTVTAYTLDGWQVTPTGNTLSWGQGFSPPFGSYMSMLCNTGITAVTLQQRIESYTASELAANGSVQPITVQWCVKNSTGATISPKIQAGYANAQDNFANVIADLASTSLQTITNGTTSVLAYTFTPNQGMANGYQIQLQFGTGLNNSTGNVWVLWADCRTTPGGVTGQNANPPIPEFPQIGRDYIDCLRYYYQMVAPATSSYCMAAGFGTTQARGTLPLPIPMRVAPSSTLSAGATFQFAAGGGGPIPTAISVSFATIFSIDINASITGVSNSAGWLRDAGGANSFIQLTSEL